MTGSGLIIFRSIPAADEKNRHNYTKSCKYKPYPPGIYCNYRSFTKLTIPAITE